VLVRMLPVVPARLGSRSSRTFRGTEVIAASECVDVERAGRTSMTAGHREGPSNDESDEGGQGGGEFHRGRWYAGKDSQKDA
jgi:hypothetical protein